VVVSLFGECGIHRCSHRKDREHYMFRNMLQRLARKAIRLITDAITESAL
jgi:hypothetical protein